ncbi:MAG TPA: S1C family serine protease [Ilumatobacteraceae bacterium]|nr:S1C family serine protease [Ilumatobacteraceae bacterium]
MGSRRLWVLIGTIAVGAAAACGGESDVAVDTTADTTTDTTSESPDTTSDSTEPPTTDAAEFDIAQVEQSVVKISAEGTFIDPEVGEQRNSAGVGSGAIISEDGLVVTNNHVVTGAALLQVFVYGENEPVNAKVLGVTECSDLAVIQLDGDGYVALDYRTDDVTAGLDVYAAGFPASDANTLDDVDYTLTRGIVSSTTASGETSWASVDEVIEHDARIRGGNSGGPLVDEQGRIVGINYAGLDDSDQNYAISAADAQDIIEELAAGTNIDSIGVNGEAVNDGAGTNGIWVASVDSGSPADAAGIEPGDIITRLEGLDLALDGTMSDYCDVIRTQGADATMSVEVLRFATEEVYEGQLNGTPLELSFSFAQEFQEGVGTEDAATDAYTDFVTVSDDSGSVTTSVPAEWADIDGQPNENFGPSLYAAPDLESFLNTFDTPGVIIEATGERGVADIDTTLDELDLSDQCTYVGRTPYADVLYTGSLDEYSDCAGTGTSIFIVAVTPEDGSFLARLLIQAVEPRDLDAADQIFASFVVSP